MNSALIDFDQFRHGEHWGSWGSLATNAPPFLAPEFFALARGSAGPGEALVAGAWSDNAFAGALPLVLDHHVLRALRGDHSPGYDYCGSLDGIAAIWKNLRDDDRWSELVLDKVPRDSLLASSLPALARADGSPVVVRADTRHPFFALPGFEARMKPKFRTNLQRCARKAGALVLERIVVPTRDDLAEAFAIEGMAWKAVGGTAIAADAQAVHLYEAAARVLGRRGRSSLSFLRIGGKRVAMLLAFEDRHTLYALKIGYDPAYASLSPGHLIVWKVAADAEQRGLRELDFVGREDDWKRKWTDEAHERVTIVIYRRSPRGLLRYSLRELIKPRLPETLRETPRSPLPRHCQRADVVGDHSIVARVRGRIDRGLGIKSGLRRALRRVTSSAAPVPRLGEASAFPIGTWVRVRDRAAIRATLDAHDKLRGLAFVSAQWHTCGGLFRVAAHVRRLRDDHGRYRAVSRTVRLEGVDCSFGGPQPQGCGRHCPLMYRDEWLEAAAAPRLAPPGASQQRHARVRDAADIAKTLDLFGRRDGVTFMPEMAQHAGKRFAIAGRIDEVYEHDRWIATRSPLYLLDGAHCTGELCGDRGPCDRACALMWHPDWLVFEEP